MHCRCVCSLLLLCLLLLSVEERRRDIAALRLMGISRATVVVDTGSGPVWSACISFDGTISGTKALELAGAFDGEGHDRRRGRVPHAAGIDRLDRHEREVLPGEIIAVDAQIGRASCRERVSSPV